VFPGGVLGTPGRISQLKGTVPGLLKESSMIIIGICFVMLM